MADVRLAGPDLGKVAAALREAGDKKALAAMRKALRDSAAPIVSAERSAARSLTFVTVGAGNAGRRSSSAATTARARARATHTVSLAEAVATGKRHATARRMAAIAGKRRLREQIATGIRAQTSERKGELTVAVRTNRAPAFITSRSGQRRASNHGEWRHPVFANRAVDRSRWVWVTQRITNPAWWDQAAESAARPAEAAIATAVEQWVGDTAAAITSAAH